MDNMNANEEVDHYTELAQIALTWIQINNNPNAEERQRDQQLLYQTYGKGAVMTGFQVALGMLLRHGADAENLTMDEHIGQVRGVLNAVKKQHKSRLAG